MRVINYILFIFALVAMTGTASADYYYADITITNNPGIEDYQTATTLYHRDGMASDFSNVRVYDSTGTEISYYLEDIVSDTSATLWYQIDSGTETVQVRWGIDGETVDESTTGIFTMFDDFSSDTSANYQSVGGGSVSYDSVNECLKQGTYAVTSYFIVSKTPITLDSYVYECDIKITDDGASRNHGGAGCDFLTSAVTGYRVTHLDATFVTSKWLNGAESGLVTNSDGGIYADDRWLHYKISRVRSSGLLRNDVTYGGTTITTSATDTSYSTGSVALHSYGCIPMWDNIIVRKYAATEPSTAVGLTQIYSDEEEPEEDEPTLTYGNHVITYQDTTIWINTTESAPIAWTVDGVTNAETGQNLSIVFEDAGNHYVSANGIDNTIVTVRRALATGSVEAFEEGNYNNITTHLEDSDWEGFASDSTQPYTDLIGKPFWLILFVLPFVLNWKKQETLTISTVMALIFGVLIISFIPTTYITFLTIAVILAFAVNLNGLMRDRN